MASVDLFAGGGEMGALMRATDWSKTKLGPVAAWPQSLKTMLGVVLGSRFPMLLWWGPDLLHLYNDAYRPILRDKHPASLAEPAALIWAEVWDFAGPLARSVQEGGPATWMEDVQLFINSGPMQEETYFTFSYSPVPGDDGRVGGILNTVQETTAKVQSERQIQMLHDLAARASDAKTETEAYMRVAAVLSGNELDLPFALLFTRGEKPDDVRLVASSRWRSDDDAGTWPFAEVLRTGQEVVVDDLAAALGTRLPPVGSWNARPERAIVLPLFRLGQTEPYAFMVAGVSPHRALDDRYRRFFRRTVDQVMNVVDKVRSYEAEIRWSRELEGANKELEAFSYSVSHDLRAPLRAIDGFSHALLTDYESKLDEQGRDYLQRVRAATKRMTQLIDDLLSLSKITRASLARQRVDLSDLAKHVLTELGGRDPARRVTIRVADDLVVQADPRLITVMLENLLGNAWKFTSKQAAATIEVGKESRGEETVFYIKDNGAGFSMEHATKLFAPFQRLHAAEEFEGTGIGLATVNRVVVRHGGRVWAEARPGQGATFLFTLGDNA
jgi:signal transduction histidine kinase